MASTKEESIEKVIGIIVDKLGVNKDETTPEAQFVNDLGADSLDTVELIMELEREFEIEIPDDKAAGIETVQNAIDYVLNELKLA